MAKFVVFFIFACLAVSLTAALTPQYLVSSRRNLIEGLDKNYQIIAATLERGYRSLRLFLMDSNTVSGEEFVSKSAPPYEHPVSRWHNHLGYFPFFDGLNSWWHPWWPKRYGLH